MLRVNEIFHSIQGESSFAGLPCVFVRLTGCNLRCVWCDTAYAFHDGRPMSVDEVVAAVERYRCPLVEVTGGEPLLQPETPDLLRALLAHAATLGARVSAALDSKVCRSNSVRPPGARRDTGEAGPGVH